MRLQLLIGFFYAGTSGLAAPTAIETTGQDGIGLRIEQFARRFENEPDKVIRELKALANDAERRPFAVQVLEKLAQLDFKSMSVCIDVAQSLVNNIEPLAGAKTAGPHDLQWIGMLESSIARDFTEGELHFGKITGVDAEMPSRQEDRNRVEAALRSRKLLYRQLCEAAISIPGISGEYFAKLTAFSQYAEIPELELLRLCQQSLKLLTAKNIPGYIGKPQAPRKQLGDGGLLWDANATPESEMGPIPWIIEYAFRAQRPSLLTDPKLLPSREGLDKAILMLARYYFCEPDQFTKTIELVEKFSLPSNPKTPFWDPRIQWVMMRRAMLFRPEAEKSFNLGSLVSTRLNKNAGYITRQFAVDQIRIISMEKEAGEISAFLEKITAAMSLDLSKLKREGTEIPELVEFLNSVGPSPGCLFPVLAFAQKAGQAPYIRFDLHHPPGEPKRSYDIILAIYRSPLFFGIDKIQTFPASDFPKMELDDRYDSIAGFKLHEFLLMLCGENNEQARKGLRETFAKFDTFGGRLMVSLFEEQAHDAVLAFFSERIEKIEQLPEAQKTALAILAKDLICPACLTKLYSSEDRQTLRWIINTAKAGEFGRLQQYAEATSIAELQIEPKKFKDKVGKALNRALGYDWRKAYPAFENLAKLGETAVMGGEIDAGEDSFTYQLIEQTLDSADPVNAFAFAIKALQSQSLPTLFKQNPRFEDRLFHFINAGEGEADKLKRFIDFVDAAYGEIDRDSDLSVTVPLFATLHQRLVLDPGLLPAMAAWAKKAEGEGSYPQLAPHIELASMLRMSKRGGPTPEAVEQLAKLIAGGNFTDSARVMQGLMIATFDDHDSAQLLKYNLGLLAQLWEKHGADLEGEMVFHTLRALEKRRRNISPKDYAAQGWTAAEINLASAYDRHVLKEGKVARRVVPADDISPFIKEEMVRILAKMGRRESVEQMIAEDTPELKNPLQIFSHLVRSGAFDSATEILRKDWIALLDTAPVHVIFDQALADQIKPYLKSIAAEPAWSVWLAEYLLVRPMARNGEEPPKGWPKHNVRMHDIGLTFKPESFPDNESQMRILLSVIENSDLRPLFNQKLLDLSAPLTFSSVIHVQDEERRRLLSSAYFYRLQHEVADGDIEALTELFGQIDRLATGIDQETAGLARDRLRWMQGVLTSREVTEKCKDPIFARRILPVLTAIGSRRSFGEMDGDASTFIAAAIFLHYVMGEPSKIRNYINNGEFPSAAYLHQLFEGHAREFALFEAAAMLHGHGYGIQPFDFGSREDQQRRRRPFPPAIQSTIVALRGIDEDFNFTPPADDKANAFLAAKTVAETGFAPQRFIPEVSRLIQGHDRVVAQRKIYDKALALVQNALASKDGWYRSYGNGWNAAGQIFQSTALPPPDPDWRHIALLADVLWNDTPKGFSLVKAPDSGLERCAASMWEQAVIGSGKRITARTLPQMFDSLRNALPQDDADWGHTAVFRPVFFEVCAAINNPALLKGLVQQTGSAKDPLAIEFNLAAQMWLAQAAGSEGLVSGEDEQWVKAATAVMDLGDSPALRAFFAQHLLTGMIHSCPKSLRQKLYQDTAWLMGHNESVNGWHLTTVLNSFSTEEHDPYWKIAAENFINTWKNLTLPHRDPPQPWLDYEPQASPVLAVLNLHYQLGKPQAAESYFSANSLVLNDDAATLALLVREGSSGLAGKWLAQERTGFIPVAPSPSASTFQITYDAKLRRQFSLFQATLDSDEARYFARLVIEAIPDAKRAGEAIPSQAERIKSLAESFSLGSFSSTKNQTLAIQALSRYWQISEKTIPPLEEYFTKERLDATFKNAKGYSGVQRALSPVTSLVGGKILYQGDQQALSDYLARVNGSLSEGDQFYAMNSLVAMLNTLLFTKLENSDSLTSDQLNSLLQSLTLVLEKLTPKKMAGHWANLVYFQTIVATLLDSGEALSTWRSGIDDKQRATLRLLYSLGHNQFPFDQILKNDPAKLKRVRQAVESDPSNQPGLVFPKRGEPRAGSSSP